MRTFDTFVRVQVDHSRWHELFFDKILEGFSVGDLVKEFLGFYQNRQVSRFFKIMRAYKRLGGRVC